MTLPDAHGSPPARAAVILGLVVPCHDEEQVLPSTTRRLLAVLDAGIAAGQLSPECRILYVDDGSRDSTWACIQAAAKASSRVSGLRLSRNFGHQMALLAGLHHLRPLVDCAITIDADLQQDETAIPAFVTHYQNGAEIVFGVRRDRGSDGFRKRASAELFYVGMRLLGVNVIPNHADYRLLGSKAMLALEGYREQHLFLRGIFASMGFPSERLEIAVSSRTAGTTSYTPTKMFALALDAIFSFSIWPIRMMTGFGGIIFCASVAMAFYVLSVRLFTTQSVPGWASTVLPIYALGGIQIFFMGIIGEYVGRIYMEAKQRPRYLVDELVNIPAVAASTTR